MFIKSTITLATVILLIADITVFDPQRVIDRATFEMPNQYPEGIQHVIVNGQISV